MKSEAIVEVGKPLQTIESETPKPQGKQVLLKITHSGVCHSDGGWCQSPCLCLGSFKCSDRCIGLL